ncbi:MAG: peptidoglycan-binding protein [Eubacteriales bacterium]|nr:peptidoglycan-binding protein [Eubacteriales bacterium]
MKKRILCVVFAFLLAAFNTSFASSAVDIPPSFEVPLFVEQLLGVAQEELGYTEKSDGSTKYGAWYGDRTAEWCAEFLCWSVNETDARYGTELLKKQYPLYGATNVGLNWFLKEGRFVSRNGTVNGWGRQWFKSSGKNIALNEYIAQPGDWVFFSYTPSGDTTHVAMVEKAFKNEDGIYIQVFEGNMPDKVQRRAYAINDWRIIGYGTVHDVAGIAMRHGNEGKKVTELQKELSALKLLDSSNVNGVYDNNTENSIKRFQAENKLTATGIADKDTQLLIKNLLEQNMQEDNSFWIVEGGI